VLAPLAPAIAFAAFGAVHIVSAGATTGYGGADVARARAAIESVVPADAIVLVSSGLGRPAENWTHYTHAHAHYLVELPRLFSDANYVCFRTTLDKRPCYLLLNAADPMPFTVPPDWVQTRMVARRDGPDVRDWFVDPKKAPAGVVLYEATISIPQVPAP
jgi:hypothetical protein